MKLKHLFCALPALISALWVHADTIDEQTMKQYFSQYNRANQCWVANVEQGSYCMKIDASKIVDTASGKQKYILVAGDRYDFTKNEADGAHVHSGTVAMFVLRQVNNKWQVIAADTEIDVGAYGRAPTDWTFHQFGPDTYGFLNVHGDMHQGHMGSDYAILVHDGKKIAKHWVGAGADNENADVDEAEVTVLESKLKVDSSASVKTGLYPLLITVNGRDGKKRYSNSVYKIPYDQTKKTYAPPKNYPLGGIGN